LPASSQSPRYCQPPSEALSLMRMRDKLGDLSQFDEVTLVTAGRHVCGFCVNDNGTSGLASIAQALGIKRLKIKADIDADSGFRFQGIPSATEVAIENGIVTFYMKEHKYRLTIPRKHESNPSIQDIEQAFKNQELANGALSDISLSYTTYEAGLPIDCKKLFFWVNDADKIASIYSSKKGWFGFSGSSLDGTDIQIDDGGGCGLTLNTKLLQQRHVALHLCSEFLEKGSIDMVDGWIKVSAKYLG